MTAAPQDGLGLCRHYEPLIGGRFGSYTDRKFPACDAATGRRLATLTRSGPDEVAAAVAAARVAFPAWAATGRTERSMLVHRLADWIEENLDRLAEIDALDTGRVVAETPLDHLDAVEHYRFFAAAAVTRTGRNRRGWALGRREPLGVVGRVLPWHAPASAVAATLAPALASGNTVVLAPDAHASLSMMELAKALAGIFPAGVVNVVPGLGEAAAALTAHGDVDRLVPRSCGRGGKGTHIVFPDLEDVARVAAELTRAVILGNGQAGPAAARLFLHTDGYDAFLEKLVAEFERVPVGLPADPASRLGCLVSAEHGERVLEDVDVGRGVGKLVTGGGRVSVAGAEAGFFVEPTIFETESGAEIAPGGISAPVLSVVRWSDSDLMIGEVDYAPAVGVHTGNLGRALRTADRVRSETVWVNGFPGPGLGGQRRAETLDRYTRRKTVLLGSR